MTAPRFRAGFTLMEMLVTLVLLSFTTLLIYQMLGSYRIARERAMAMSSGVDRQVLFDTWFRASVQGLFIDNRLSFKGDRQSFAATTLNPLYAREGMPVEVEWRLLEAGEGSRQIAYSEDGRERWRLTLAGAASAYFVYLDAAGNPDYQWPLPDAPATPPTLPSGVVLVREDETGADRAMVASVLGPLEPVLRLYSDDQVQ